MKRDLRQLSGRCDVLAEEVLNHEQKVALLSAQGERVAEEVAMISVQGERIAAEAKWREQALAQAQNAFATPREPEDAASRLSSPWSPSSGRGPARDAQFFEAYH